VTQTVNSARQLTTGMVLFGKANSEEVLGKELDRNGVTGRAGAALGGLSPPSRKAAGEQIAGIMSGLLDLDLDNLLIGGWRKHGDLTAAARRTTEAPGSREVLELATHRVTSTHRPYVELLVDGVPMTRVHCELSVEFLVQAVVGVVGDGRLLELRCGYCDVTATLEAEGRQLAARQVRLELPGVIRLGGGIPLIHPVPVRAH
jgi:hypothetical protein